jgi:hypothetical protein
VGPPAYQCEYWADGPRDSVEVSAFTVAEAVARAGITCRGHANADSCSDISCE